MEIGDNYRIHPQALLRGSPPYRPLDVRQCHADSQSLIKLSNNLEMPFGYFFLAKPIDDTPQIFAHRAVRNSGTQQWNVSRTHEKAEGDSYQTCRSAFGGAMSIVRTTLCAVCSGALYTVGFEPILPISRSHCISTEGERWDLSTILSISQYTPGRTRGFRDLVMISQIRTLEFRDFRKSARRMCWEFMRQ